MLGRLRWSNDPTASFAESERLVEKALELDDAYAEAYSSLSRIFRSAKRDFERATEFALESVELAPNCAECLRELAFAHVYGGSAEEGIRLLETAMRLEPVYSSLYLHGLWRAQFRAERFDDALATASELLKHRPKSYVPQAFLAMTYASLGRVEEARMYGRETLRFRPQTTASSWQNRTPFRHSADAVGGGAHQGGNPRGLGKRLC